MFNRANDLYPLLQSILCCNQTLRVGAQALREAILAQPSLSSKLQL